MKARRSKSILNEYITKLVLIGIFLSGFVIVVLTVPGLRQGHQALNLSILDAILLILATMRLGRMIAYDRVAEPLRAPFAQTVPDETGAGESVEPRGEGIQQTIGQLITCPICAGTWIAAILVYGLYVFPGPARVLITVFAVIGGAEILGGVIEALCWSAQLARTISGEKNIARRSTKDSEGNRDKENVSDSTREEKMGSPPYIWKVKGEEEEYGHNRKG